LASALWPFSPFDPASFPGWWASSCSSTAGAYLISAATYFVIPARQRAVFWGAAPLYGLGEIGIIGWLLIRGAREDVVTA
jgi:hypothetical protein